MAKQALHLGGAEVNVWSDTPYIPLYTKGTRGREEAWTKKFLFNFSCPAFKEKFLFHHTLAPVLEKKDCKSVT